MRKRPKINFRGGKFAFVCVQAPGGGGGTWASGPGTPWGGPPPPGGGASKPKRSLGESPSLFKHKNHGLKTFGKFFPKNLQCLWHWGGGWSGHSRKTPVGHSPGWGGRMHTSMVCPEVPCGSGPPQGMIRPPNRKQLRSPCPARMGLFGPGLPERSHISVDRPHQQPGCS